MERLGSMNHVSDRPMQNAAPWRLNTTTASNDSELAEDEHPMNTTTSYPILPSRPILPHIATSCSNSRCNVPLEFPVPSPQPRPGTLLQIRCFQCQNITSHAFYPGQVPSSSIAHNGGAKVNSNTGNKPSSGPSSAGAQPRKGRKIGTQERPLETGYYDILGVPITATADDIKKAYSTVFPQSPFLLDAHIKKF